MKEEEIAMVTDLRLLNYYVWGEEPENVNLMTIELEKRKINIETLTEEIEDLIYQAKLRTL